MHLKPPIANLKPVPFAPAPLLALVQAGGRAMRMVWWYLRQITGDAGYENYLRGRGARSGGSVLSREEFYLDAVRRKYTGVSRCC